MIRSFSPVGIQSIIVSFLLSNKIPEYDNENRGDEELVFLFSDVQDNE